MKTYLLLFLITCFNIGCTMQSANAQAPTVSSGKIEQIENFKSRFISPRNVDVWLPDGYSSNEKYAVLYMHDGQMLFDAALTWNNQEWGVDETIGKLIKEQKIDKCIVVGVWNSGKSRHSDYFPQKPFERLSQTFRDSLLQEYGTTLFPTKIQSDNYLKFLVKELKPYIDSTYATYPDKAHTFIAGSSMGGLISLYAICEYPEVFGGAACISTHWPGIFTDEDNPIPAAFIDYLKQRLPDPATHKLYFDYGTETLDAMYEPYQLQADALMKCKGYNDKNWKTLKFTGEDHSENAWGKRLHIPVTFLLGKGKSSKQ
ncbi:alpha/beta hydrolase [Pontibacter ruber]|uniref:Alpha/beta hydrolase n=1 Tax=Pontibacter ruber TaxID=1343895 RepID=A0ABW5D3H2_9BACT|nr:alpha/beta hydrolase-fold protein [Pontibacter ruber]